MTQSNFSFLRHLKVTFYVDKATYAAISEVYVGDIDQWGKQAFETGIKVTIQSNEMFIERENIASVEEIRSSELEVLRSLADNRIVYLENAIWEPSNISTKLN